MKVNELEYNIEKKLVQHVMVLLRRCGVAKVLSFSFHSNKITQHHKITAKKRHLLWILMVNMSTFAKKKRVDLKVRDPRCVIAITDGHLHAKVR